MNSRKELDVFLSETDLPTSRALAVYWLSLTKTVNMLNVVHSSILNSLSFWDGLGSAVDPAIEEDATYGLLLRRFKVYAQAKIHVDNLDRRKR